MNEQTLFAQWIADLERRHFADLTVAEVARALRALSSAYVERRESGIRDRRALDGKGKRAAFALYYAPLHFLLVRQVCRAIGGAAPNAPPAAGTTAPPELVVDLGCGTGAAGAAAALPGGTTTPRPIAAIDSHPWALDEARRTYRAFGLDATVKRGDVARIRFPRHAALAIAAFLVNELDEGARHALQRQLFDLRSRGGHALIVEPISRRVSPWWPAWTSAFEAAGGRADEWKLHLDAPPIVRRLGRAAGLTTDVLAGRSLWM